jgi:hypothetical protein
MLVGIQQQLQESSSILRREKREILAQQSWVQNRPVQQYKQGSNWKKKQCKPG